MSARFSTVLADDVVDLRYMVRLALEDSGRFEIVAEATNGLEAVELAKRHQPDLLLLDISMPIQDGLESLPQIKEVAPDTTVVMLSGFEANRLAETATAAGASAYIEKGVPPRKLVDRLLHIMGGATAPSGAPTLEVVRESPREMDPNELLSFVAHEIRNPLSVIHGFGSTLVEQWDRLDDARKRDVVGRITANAGFLDAVLNNVMQMRTNASPMSIQMDAEDPKDVVAALVQDLSPLAAGTPIETEVEPDLPMVLVDRHRLRQVVTNLVVNAIKFAPPGSPITIRASRGRKGLLLEVIDRGPGIPLEQRESVFGRYVQLSPGGKGLGLGLYICRGLLSAMGGEIWIGDSEAGTRVCLLLQVREAAPVD